MFFRCLIPTVEVSSASLPDVSFAIAEVNIMMDANLVLQIAAATAKMQLTGGGAGGYKWYLGGVLVVWFGSRPPVLFKMNLVLPVSLAKTKLKQL